MHFWAAFLRFASLGKNQFERANKCDALRTKSFLHINHLFVQGRFQIIDIVDHFEKITKKSVQVVEAGLIPTTVRELIRIATREKPGPVHLELPEDIAEQTAEAPLIDITPTRRACADDRVSGRSRYVSGP